MDDEEAIASSTNYSSSLARSYSEHAALVLQHYQQHRRRPEPPRCTRSGPEFHRKPRLVGNEADDEDEDADPRNDGQRTWRISTSTDDKSSYPHRRKMIEMGCGDSGALTDQFSDLSLTQQRGDGVLLQPAFSSSSQNTTTTTSSTERRCRMFDDEEDDENLTLELDNDDDMDEQYRAYSRDRSSNNEFEKTSKPAHTDVVVTSLSTTSLSTVTSRQRLNGIPLQRQISYENWSREKHREHQRRKDEQRKSEMRRREMEEREKREREEKERRDYECFLDWLERKKREKMIKRELVEKELDLQRRILDVEEKAKVAKDISLREWYRKKEEEQKAIEKKELVKQKQAEQEKQRRFQDSTKAYEKWREKAKYTPRPATQGLLPHQKAKPLFTNPTPWQPLVDNASDDSDTDNHVNQIKTSGTTIKSQRSKKASVKR